MRVPDMDAPERGGERDGRSRHVGTHQRGPLGRWLTWAVLGAGLFAVWLIPLDQLPSACLTRRLTGIPCPTCGVGRSLHALLHGDIASSLRYHPLLLPFLILGFLWWAVVVRPAAKAGRRVPAHLQVATLAAALVTLLAVWLVRLATSSVP
ncbi:MAG: hypothetical protein KatS3mg024_1878 [Armatimonadota bacterium]|nr:MAG: hypothetical protein KatS3mg024_1878 [Armatimonadota bacterium]